MQRKHIKQIFWIALSNILDVHKTINLVILFEIMAICQIEIRTVD
jgi:hypothetical protein